jgi:hypothetical protein
MTMSPHESAGAGRVREIVGKAQELKPEASGEGLPWPSVAQDVHHGLAGEVVRNIEPHTESDPMAILVQYLSSFGNAIGRGPYYQVEGDRHFTNLFAVLVGQSSKARKGTAAGRIRQIFEVADPEWIRKRNHGGMSSGEGLIWQVRDPIKQWVKGETGKSEREVDPGVQDKRLMIFEPEFGGVLQVMQRQGNTLSRVIRDAWDRGDLDTLVKNAPARATGAHVSIVGHITDAELRKGLDRVSMANGYANRFLFVCVRRARVLPHGGSLPDETVRDLGNRTCLAIEEARKIGRVRMNQEARRAWERLYPTLSEGQPGLLGAILGRAEAQTVRLAVLYALLGRSAEIKPEHLRAAVALWEYCEASARYIFDELLGDRCADQILQALRHAGSAGMTRTKIRDMFQRHVKAAEIDEALTGLLRAGKARFGRHSTGGAPVEVWLAI